MADSIANATDSEFLDIMDSVRNALGANPADYPMITTEMKTALDDHRDAFGDSLPVHTAAQANARAKRLAKDADRDAGEAVVRSIRNMCKGGGVTDAQMAALGTPTSSSEAPSTATVPAVKINTSERLRHTIEWFDNASPDNRRRPRGTMGAEIWNKIDGPPPVDEHECNFVTLDSRSPYMTEYYGSDAGKMAHYMLRWRGRDGSVSAWGETVSATITG